MHIIDDVGSPCIFIFGIALQVTDARGPAGLAQRLAKLDVTYKGIAFAVCIVAIL